MASPLPEYTGKDLIQSVHDKDVVKLAAVVNSGISVTYRTKRGTSVLHVAAMLRDKEMMLHLLKKYPLCIEIGKKLDKQKGYNAMHHWCANEGDSEVFDQLTRAGFDCKDTTSAGQTSLDLAKNTKTDVLVKHIESVLKDPSIGDFSTWTELHECAIDGEALTCLNLIENNNGADVMKCATCPRTNIKIELPPSLTPLEVAVYFDNCAVLRPLVMYTEYHIIQKCLKIVKISTKAKQCLLREICSKLRKEYKEDCVVFGKICGEGEENKGKVCVVFSKTKTHGKETKKAGYRILFRNPSICEKDGRDEGREVLQHCHRRNYLLSDTDKTRIDKAINSKCDHLWAKHSNIRGFISSPVKCSKGKFIETPCVVILCLFKSFIPENESRFPDVLNVDDEVVPVDVREGCFNLVGCDNPLATHVRLNMGCNIGTNDETSRFGTLGPFVDIEGKLAFLTCAHVMFSLQECLKKAGVQDQSRGTQLDFTQHGGTRREDREHDQQCDPHESESTKRLALQPASSSSGVSSGKDDRECGQVKKWDYAIDQETSIDIAVVEITKQDRIPLSGRFTVYDMKQLKMSGYANDEPTFDTGKVGQPTYVEGEREQAVPAATEDGPPKPDGRGEHIPDPRNNIILFGSSSGLTNGKYRNSSKVQFTTKLCGTTNAHERYRGLYYIDNSQCEETHCKLPPLALFGDSGAGVYQRMDDNSLVCIGVLVAVDNTGSALVIPIDPILKHFDVKLKVF
ncbi:uncharacterized protein LOC110466980 [Mizuhopecten yessoensis]|uniref:Uncharacterized protein n=1 Tax=Mizuhopecten yessoensis TaxID=6573 RepID=A0A210PMZ9_MIZYE|nr:uncharacterized protein LOC110466980 [Mizuhopecten yessoensis]XP_021379494.1 uncharacterized protein LOC110466980 [Mizuhopecten yessoensis]XP_021379495.1 uncharacterized protein LOC110466980 [Mizuhopecten yessoensis]OWF37834.1 hypothetical protein KP79_PYT22624 [Mizuhopecten yessoensis]